MNLGFADIIGSDPEPLLAVPPVLADLLPHEDPPLVRTKKSNFVGNRVAWKARLAWSQREEHGYLTTIFSSICSIASPSSS